MIKLAIVIPYYKIDFFEETLKSVALQTDKRFTLYIGNDASSDDPFPVIKKYFDENEFQYFNYQENLGGKNLALQWERILENVEEEWFQILGDDDIVTENFVQNFYSNLHTINEEGLSVIKYSHQIINDNRIILHDVIYKGETILPTELFMLKYKGMSPSSLSENIFLRRSYVKHKFLKIPFAWGADDYAILTFSEFNKVFLINDSKVVVRISENSISGDLSLQKKKDYGYHQMRENVLNKYSSHFDKSFLIRMLNDHLKYCKNNSVVPHLNLFSILFKRRFLIRYYNMTKEVYRIKSNIKVKKR